MNFPIIKYLLSTIFIISFVIANAQQVSPKEQEMIDVINQFRKSTVSFGLVRKETYQDIDGQIISKKIFKPIGTGVCFYFNFQKGIVPCLITAKHVFQDSSQGWLPDTLFVRFSQADTFSIDKYFGIPLVLKTDSFQNSFPHPDPKVDLACLPLDPTYSCLLR